MLKKLKIRNSRYFLDLFTAISIFVVLVIILLSSVLLNVSRAAMMDNIQLSNKRLLSQTVSAIDLAHRNIGMFTVSLYSSYAGIKLLNVAGLDNLEKTVTTNTITEYMRSVPNVHSVYLINKTLDNYQIIGSFATTGYNAFFDKSMLELMNELGNGDILEPKPRKIPESSLEPDEYVNVYSYIIYDKLPFAKPVTSAMVVNVKADYFMNTLYSLKIGEEESYKSINIINEQGILVGSMSEADFLKDVSDKGYIKKMLASTEETGFFIDEVDGVENLITYQYYKPIGWYVYNAIPIKIITAPVDKVKNTTFAIIILALVAVLLTSYTLSRTIYRPVGRLFNQFQKLSPSDSKELSKQNEILYISNSVKNFVTKMEDLKSFQRFNINVIRENFLTKLLTDENMLLDSNDKLDKYGIKLKPDGNFAIIIFRLDNYLQMQSTFSAYDLSIFNFAIKNISNEILFESFECESVGKEDQVIILMNIYEDIKYDETFIEHVTPMIKAIQQTIKKYYDISLSAAISSITDNLSRASSLYKDTLELSEYRIIYGDGSIISQQMLDVTPNSKFEYPVKLVKKLIDDLKLADPEHAKECYEQIISYVSGYSVNNIRFTLIHLFSSIYHELNGIKKNGIGLIDIDFLSIYNRINKLETLEQIKDEFFELFSIIVNRIEQSKNEKADKVIKTAIDYIDANYADRNLSVNMVAGKVMMSPVYFGVLFREATSKSIADYINEVRLLKAEDLLKNTDLTITEIMEFIGWENQKYFYVKFKKQFGLTPTVFRLNQIDKK